MHARTLALSLAPLFAAPLAHAQAPGEVAPQVIIVTAAPAAAAAPVVVAPAPVAPPAPACARRSVMDNRWAVGLSVGSMSLAPDSRPDDSTEFGVGELSLRFRASPRLEFELAVGGGRERTADDLEGDREVSTAMLAARLRFRPESAWNWFVMAGIGGAAVTLHDASDQEREDAMRPLGMLGIGLERRFRHFALQAEARAIGIGEKDPGDMTWESDLRLNPPIVAPANDEKRAGGSFTLGASYYF